MKMFRVNDTRYINPAAVTEVTFSGKTGRPEYKLLGSGAVAPFGIPDTLSPAEQVEAAVEQLEVALNDSVVPTERA